MYRGVNWIHKLSIEAHTRLLTCFEESPTPITLSKGRAGKQKFDTRPKRGVTGMIDILRRGKQGWGTLPTRYAVKRT